MKPTQAALLIRAGLVFLMVFFLGTLSSGVCKTEIMTDTELALVTGQGTTNLYVEGSTVRLFLDIHMEPYGTLASGKAGYWNRGTPDDPVFGWDMNWKNVVIGESYDNPLVIDGLVLQVEFNHDVSAQDKSLTRIIIGTNHMKGEISGDFPSTSGAVNPGVLGLGGTDPLVMIRGDALQAHSLLNMDGGFFLEINLDGQSPERGVRAIIGYPESAAVNMTFTGTDWWSQ